MALVIEHTDIKKYIFFSTGVIQSGTWEFTLLSPDPELREVGDH